MPQGIHCAFVPVVKMKRNALRRSRCFFITIVFLVCAARGAVQEYPKPNVLFVFEKQKKYWQEASSLFFANRKAGFSR